MTKHGHSLSRAFDACTLTVTAIESLAASFGKSVVQIIPPMPPPPPPLTVACAGGGCGAVVAMVASGCVMATDREAATLTTHEPVTVGDGWLFVPAAWAVVVVMAR